MTRNMGGAIPLRGPNIDVDKQKGSSFGFPLVAPRAGNIRCSETSTRREK